MVRMIRNGKNRLIGFIAVLILMSMCFSFLIVYEETRYAPSQVEIDGDINLYGPTLDYYYIDFSKSKYLDASQYHTFDRNGIPLFKIAEKYYYHPVHISQFALGAYGYYLKTKDATAKQIFLKCADWLTGNVIKSGNFYYWEYAFKAEWATMQNGRWFSAMAQGEGVSVLLRAFCETGDKRYLQVARNMIRSIFYDVTVGGVSAVRGSSYIFPQEYPSITSSDVLNGAIFAYFGVYDYYRVTGDPDVKEFGEIIAKTISSALDQFDAGYWSLYCRRPKYLAPPFYNSLHVTQLKIVYLITGDKRFLSYSQKFEEYQKNRLNRIRYAVENHIRQAREFRLKDIRRVSAYFKGQLRLI